MLVKTWYECLVGERSKLYIDKKLCIMKIRSFILSMLLFVLPLFLLNLYGNPEQTTRSMVFNLVLLIIVAVVNNLIMDWLHKKYPYQSSYKPKNKPNLEATPEKISE